MSRASSSAMTWFRPCPQALQRPLGDMAGRGLGRVYPRRHVGVDEASINADHLGALRPQLDPRRIGYCERRMFGGAVGGIKGIDKPADHREHVDDSAAAVAG